LAAIREGKRRFPLINAKKRRKYQKSGKTYENSGELEVCWMLFAMIVDLLTIIIIIKQVLGWNLVQAPSMLEYIAGGLEIALMVGIDFTSSNGPPSHPQSLHRQVKVELQQHSCHFELLLLLL
jgi:hypothetical protein